MPKVRFCELTNTTTGEVKSFESTVDADRFLSRKPGYVRRRTERGLPVMDSENIYEYTAKLMLPVYIPPQNPFNRMEGYVRQLCWDCEKAVGGCPWSREFKPVEGWTAVKVALNNQQKTPDTTYSITACPLFSEG